MKNRKLTIRRIALTLLLPICQLGVPLAAAHAQATRASTDSGTATDSRWKGQLFRGIGARCGAGFWVTIDAVVRNGTISGTIERLDQNWKESNWNFSEEIDADGSFRIWAPFDLYSRWAQRTFDANMELKGSTRDGVKGKFAVYVENSTGWDCHGTFELDAVDRPPTAVATKSEAGGTAAPAVPTAESSPAHATDTGPTKDEPKTESRQPKAVAAADGAPAKTRTDPVAETPSAAQPAPTAEASEAAIDLAFWTSITGSSDPEMYRAYLNQFPDGQFAALARIKLGALQQPGRVGPVAGQPVADPFKNIHFGTYHALIVGNVRYRYFSRLKTATADARAVDRLLREDYGFVTKLLLDATRADVIDTLAEYRAKLRFDDNFLIYYAGHGVVDSVTERGYWLPVDAKANSPSNWISTGDLTAMLQAIRAKHVMVVADSCYSGALTRAVRTDLRTAADRLAWIEHVLGKRARTVLTSGGLEPVVDSGGGGHSVFAKAFIAALRENDSVLEGARLFNAVKRPVALNADQTPRYSDIRYAGHEGGDFLFVRRR